MAIDSAEIKLNWDKAKGVLSAPIHVVSGGNRFTLVANAKSPATAADPWTFDVANGSIACVGPTEIDRHQGAADPSR